MNFPQKIRIPSFYQQTKPILWSGPSPNSEEISIISVLLLLLLLLLTDSWKIKHEISTFRLSYSKRLIHNNVRGKFVAWPIRSDLKARVGDKEKYTQSCLIPNDCMTRLFSLKRCVRGVKFQCDRCRLTANSLKKPTWTFSMNVQVHLRLELTLNVL